MSPPRKPLSQPHPFLRFARVYWIELTAGLVGLAGLLILLIGGESLSRFGRGLVENIGQAAGSFSAGLRSYLIENVSPWDIFGLIFAAAGLAFILWRVRVRLPRLARHRITTCPRCGGALQRVRRTWLDRLFTGIFFPHGRRYACKDASCGWSGMLNRRYHQHTHHASHRTSEES